MNVDVVVKAFCNMVQHGAPLNGAASPPLVRWKGLVQLGEIIMQLIKLLLMLLERLNHAQVL
eukprot:m.112996 g.112996  ORF g.112996 m.112996 type:complete len:62 (+) comp13496_c0_seq1:211-396(+)